MNAPLSSDNQPFEAYDRFFAPIAASIGKLASDRGLHLEKYYQDAPCWSLFFRHPKGGIAKIDFAKKDDDRVGVSAVWWKDNFETGTRSLKWFDEEVVAKGEAIVVRSASAMLERILEHQFGAWSKTVEGYSPLWHPYGRSFIEDEEKRYQVPTGTE